MATLIELNALLGDRGALFDKVRAAILIAAEGIRANASATAAQKAWARRAFTGPDGDAVAAYNAVLAANNTATVAQLQNATDAQVQTAVGNVLGILTG